MDIKTLPVSQPKIINIVGLCEQYERQCYEMYNKLDYYRKLLMEPKRDLAYLKQHLAKDKERFDQHLFSDEVAMKQREQMESSEADENQLRMRQVHRQDGKVDHKMANPFGVRTIGIPFYQDYWNGQPPQRDQHVELLEGSLSEYKLTLSELQSELKTLNNMYMAELNKNSQRKAVINVLKRHLNKVYG